MGMYDESWCSSCGAGMHYTADESAECGACAQDRPDKLINLIEYMKIHLISLQQDYEKIPDGDRDSVLHLNGQVLATRQLLSVAEGMIE